MHARKPAALRLWSVAFFSLGNDRVHFRHYLVMGNAGADHRARLAPGRGTSGHSWLPVLRFQIPRRWGIGRRSWGQGYTSFGCGSTDRGIRTVSTVPAILLDVTAIVPPWAVVISRAINSPRPRLVEGRAFWSSSTGS